MRRIILVVGVAALMAAMVVASAMPAFAAANPKASAEGELASNYPLGQDQIGPQTSTACKNGGTHQAGGCGEEISARGKDNTGQAP